MDGLASGRVVGAWMDRGRRLRLMYTHGTEEEEEEEERHPMLVSVQVSDPPLPRTPGVRDNTPRPALCSTRGTWGNQGINQYYRVPSTNLSHSIAPVPSGTIACRRLGEGF